MTKEALLMRTYRDLQIDRTIKSLSESIGSHFYLFGDLHMCSKKALESAFIWGVFAPITRAARHLPRGAVRVRGAPRRACKVGTERTEYLRWWGSGWDPNPLVRACSPGWRFGVAARNRSFLTYKEPIFFGTEERVTSNRKLVRGSWHRGYRTQKGIGRSRKTICCLVGTSVPTVRAVYDRATLFFIFFCEGLR